MVKNGFKKLTKGAWLDRRTGRRVSRKKLPRTLNDFARLNQVEQSQILSIIYGDLPLMYNKTADQFSWFISTFETKLETSDPVFFGKALEKFNNLCDLHAS